MENHEYLLVKDQAGHRGIQCVASDEETPISWNIMDIMNRYCAFHHVTFTKDVREEAPKGIIDKVKKLLKKEDIHVEMEDDCTACGSLPHEKLANIIDNRERAKRWVTNLKK